MFGYVCGGRPLETNISQIDQNKFVFSVLDGAKINYIAIFLIPGAQLPDNLSAAVYAQLPGQEEFKFLGSLSNSKQSAIFRLNMGSASSLTNDVDEMMDADLPDKAESSVITFGISIEPAEQVEQFMAAQRLSANKSRKSIGSSVPPSQIAPTAPGDIATLAARIVANAYNYLASFVDGQGKVPIKSFDEWWNKFKSKMAADPNYLNGLTDA